MSTKCSICVRPICVSQLPSSTHLSDENRYTSLMKINTLHAHPVSFPLQNGHWLNIGCSLPVRTIIPPFQILFITTPIAYLFCF